MNILLEHLICPETHGHDFCVGGRSSTPGLTPIRDMQVWTSRHSALHQALPLDDYAADHKTFEIAPGHQDDSAHEDSGVAPGAMVSSDKLT